MYQIWTPISIAVAYFGTQQAIFGFDRNPRTFILSFVILLVGVKLLTFLSKLGIRSKWANKLRAWISTRLTQRFGIRRSKTEGVEPKDFEWYEMDELRYIP